MTKGTRRLWRGGGYIHYLDCGDGFTSITYIKAYQVVF